MKLFLTSQWLLPEFRDEFAALVGKPLDEIKVALIENGADDEEGEPKWVAMARASLTDAGIAVRRVDLRAFLKRADHEELQIILADCDCVWVGGGNTFYLNWILRDSGAAEIIAELVQKNTVYAGGSAGGIVAGPTVRGFETADDASFAPEFIAEGLSLTDVVVLPHFGRKDYGAIMREIDEKLTGQGYHTQPLTDMEALVIDDARQRVIGKHE